MAEDSMSVEELGRDERGVIPTNCATSEDNMSGSNFVEDDLGNRRSRVRKR